MKSKISIPNPCSEDWSQMKPTERGAFCNKCQFDVFDFKDKSPEEIRAVLKANSGQKTCANISHAQMDMVNTDYHIWENQTPTVLRSKFLYACLIVFGMALFPGCESPTDGHDVGDVEMEEPVGMVEEDTVALSINVENTGDYSLSTRLKGRIH